MKISVLFLVTMLSALHGEDPTSVHFWKPSTAGTKQEVNFRFEQNTEDTVTSPDELRQSNNSEFTGQIAGILTVLRVSTKGQPVELLLKISNAEFKKNGAKTELLSFGDEVHVTYTKPRSAVEVNGKTAPDEAARILRSFMETGDADVLTFDEAFGPKSKVQKGEQWELRESDVAKYLLRYSFDHIVPGSFSGHGTYFGASLYREEIADSSTLELELTCKDYEAPGQPENYKVPFLHYRTKNSYLTAPGDGPLTWGKILSESECTSEFQILPPNGQKPVAGHSVQRVQGSVEFRPAK